jgi:hypothetical protein
MKVVRTVEELELCMRGRPAPVVETQLWQTMSFVYQPALPSPVVVSSPM